MSVTAGETRLGEPLDDPARTNVLAMTAAMTERLPYFRRIAMRRLDNAADAEDAVQDAFLAAWKHLGQFKGHAQISTWLTAIVLNASRTIVRKRRRVHLLPIDGQEDGENNARVSELLSDRRPDPEAHALNAEYHSRLRHLFAHLPPGLQVVVRMRSIEGLSVRETAEAQGLTESAVKSRASRARAELRRLHRCGSGRSLSTTALREADGSTLQTSAESGPQHSSCIGFLAAQPRNTMR